MVVVATLVDVAFEPLHLPVVVVLAIVADLHPGFDLDVGAMFAALWQDAVATWGEVGGVVVVDLVGVFGQQIETRQIAGGWWMIFLPCLAFDRRW